MIYMMKWNTVQKYFFTLLIIHFVHIIEEILGNSYFIESVYGGLKWFFIINILLWIIPLMIFFLDDKKYYYKLILCYAIIMVLDGLDHIIELIVMQKSYEGGLLTGIALIIIGTILIKKTIEKKGKATKRK